MKKNGFTLIELLAIIVILAIISVITVPIILNIIDNSKKGTAKSSAYGYKDAVNKFYLDKLSEDKNYVLEDKLYKVSELKSMGVTVNGEEPNNNSWIEIKKNIITNGCLEFDKYKINITNSEIGNATKGDCIIKGDFANDSWDTIISNLNIDKTAYEDDLKKGTTKEIGLDLDNNKTIADNEKFKVRIANLSNSVENGCKEIVNGLEQHKEGFSETACGVVIEFVDIITEHRMNPYESTSSSNGNGNKGGWEYSEMRTYVNNDIYNALPNELKNKIINTTVISGHGSEDTTNFTTTDKLYLLSRREVWNYTGSYDTAQSNTRQLDYYQINNVTTGSYAAAIKKNLSITCWWLRSVASDSNSRFNNVVSSSGSYNNSDSNYTYGVSPAFRITQ